MELEPNYLNAQIPTSGIKDHKKNQVDMTLPKETNKTSIADPETMEFGIPRWLSG